MINYKNLKLSVINILIIQDFILKKNYILSKLFTKSL